LPALFLQRPSTRSPPEALQFSLRVRLPPSAQPRPAELLGPPQPAGAAEADTRGPRVISHLAAESDPDSARTAAVFASGPPPEPGPRCQGPLHPLFNRRRATLGPSPKTLAVSTTTAAIALKP
jgi:hypothetical protein